MPLIPSKCYLVGGRNKGGGGGRGTRGIGGGGTRGIGGGLGGKGGLN